MERFIPPSQDEKFYRIPSLWSFLCIFHVWVIRKKIIPVKWDSAIMKTRSSFIRKFFIDQEEMIFGTFTIIRMFKRMQKIHFFEISFEHVLPKKMAVPIRRKTAIYMDE